MIPDISHLTSGALCDGDRVTVYFSSGGSITGVIRGEGNEIWSNGRKVPSVHIDKPNGGFWSGTLGGIERIERDA